MTGKWIFINNSIVPEEEAMLHVSDLAIQRGYGVFDYLRTKDNHPLHLNLHLDRFYSSAQQMHLPVPFSKEEMSGRVQTLIQKNNLAESGIRITLTGGYAADGYTITKPNLLITQSPLHLPAEEAFEKGISLITIEHQRQLPHIKTIDYLMAIWLQPLLKRTGADDVLYYQRGIVTECPRANFFIITKEGEVVTPAQNILKGITRMRLLGCKMHKISEKEVLLEDTKNAAEAFITSTTKGILPVVQIDKMLIGNGKPGPLSKELKQELFTSL